MKELKLYVQNIFIALVILFSFKTTTAQDSLSSFETNPLFTNAHVGVAVFDPSTNKYLYNYQGNKFFVPASNLKIFTCYAAMKTLEDSLTGLFYTLDDDSSYLVKFSGDPTFLHPDFTTQPVFDFFSKHHNNLTVIAANWKNKRYGNGWAWNDYSAGYMPELSSIPIYGNTVNFLRDKNKVIVTPQWYKDSLTIYGNTQSGKYSIERNFYNNQFSLVSSSSIFVKKDIPFITSDLLSIDLLQDTLLELINYTNADIVNKVSWQKIKSQPTDTVLKIMMNRSDNFYAEQLLLMIGNEKLQETQQGNIINNLQNTYFKDLPQQPRWEDGSGLSRHNLVTPEDFIWVLNKMRTEFNADRIKAIFPTGNTGTLSGYFKNLRGKIFVKTGSLSNNISLSGFLITNSGKELIFSILVNNHQSSTGAIKKAMENYLTDIIIKL